MAVPERSCARVFCCPTLVEQHSCSDRPLSLSDWGADPVSCWKKAVDLIVAVLTAWIGRVSCCLKLQLWSCCLLCSWILSFSWSKSVIYWAVKSRPVLQGYDKASVSSFLGRLLVMTEPWDESSPFVNDALMSTSEESCVWQVLWCIVLLLWAEQMLLIACPQEPSKEAQTSPITVKTKTEHCMGTGKHRSIGSRTRLWIIHSSNASCMFHPLRLFRMLSAGDGDRSPSKAMGARPCGLWSPLHSSCPPWGWLVYGCDIQKDTEVTFGLPVGCW